MKILLAVTGSISAYKSCSITSVLQSKGHEVQCVMTDNAQKFISPMSLAALSHRPVLTNEDEWSCEDGKIPHIYYTQEWADIFVISPATANTIAKISMGIADEIVSCMSIACPLEVPKLIFPSMNTVMLENNVTESNLKNMELTGWIVGKTQEKKLACGTIGKGALEKTRTIIEMIETIETGMTLRDPYNVDITKQNKGPINDGEPCPNCKSKNSRRISIENDGWSCGSCGHLFYKEVNNEG